MAKTMSYLVGAVALVAVVASATAADYTAMRADQRVQGELLAASIAYIIDEECPSLKLRRWKMLGYGLSLNSYAKGLGYTSSEIENYVNDLDEQDRFRGIAMERLRAKGAVDGNPESFCEVGRKEIEKGSYVGSMLKGG